MARVRVDDKPRTRCVSMDMLRGGNKSQPRGDNSIDKYRDRAGTHGNENFDFLGYTFRARKVKARRGNYFTGFNPAISNASAKMIREKMRGWKFHLWSDKTIHELAAMCKPVLRGWINYYGKFYKTELYSVLRL